MRPTRRLVEKHSAKTNLPFVVCEELLIRGWVLIETPNEPLRWERQEHITYLRRRRDK